MDVQERLRRAVEAHERRASLVAESQSWLEKGKREKAHAALERAELWHAELESLTDMG